MRDMMSVLLEGVLDEELDEELGYSKYESFPSNHLFLFTYNVRKKSISQINEKVNDESNDSVVFLR